MIRMSKATILAIATTALLIGCGSGDEIIQDPRENLGHQLENVAKDALKDETKKTEDAVKKEVDQVEKKVDHVKDELEEAIKGKTIDLVEANIKGKTVISDEMELTLNQDNTFKLIVKRLNNMSLNGDWSLKDTKTLILKIEGTDNFVIATKDLDELRAGDELTYDIRYMHAQTIKDVIVDIK